MARRRQHHEEHLNHEAWAIPYGDLVTLLLAFFVVMYAISSINEGKYRVVADALSAAFGGPPRTLKPLQVGNVQLRGGAFDHPSVVNTGARRGPAEPVPVEIPMPLRRRDALPQPHGGNGQGTAAGEGVAGAGARLQLQQLGSRIEEALDDLVQRGLVRVRRGHGYLEVEIQSDLLFPSGAAMPTAAALATVRQLAVVLRDVPNAVRVEGYTDNQPIRTLLFRSNWDLSVARATSVVHELVAEGIAPQRMAAMGYGEYQPVADNATVAGRNANRRVELVILASPQAVDAVPETEDTPPQPAALQAAAEPPSEPQPTVLANAGTGGLTQANGAP